MLSQSARVCGRVAARSTSGALKAPCMRAGTARGFATEERLRKDVAVADEDTSLWKALDRAAGTLFMTELYRGWLICTENYFKPKVTINYPFEKGPISPRFRGE